MRETLNVAVEEKAADSPGTGQKEMEPGASAFTPMGLSSCLHVQKATPSISEAALENNNWESCWPRARQALAFGTHSNASAWAEDMLAAG